ncbi:MAG TPA: carbohydrate porin, partial [Novosphingobium sp.]|nr:carbohydrate porin [Novosphingobium sp.]
MIDITPPVAIEAPAEPAIAALQAAPPAPGSTVRTAPDTTGSATQPAAAAGRDVPAWRQNLRDHGVDLTFAYQSESAAAVTGGARDGSAYTQQLLLSAAVDTGKAFGLEGGKFIFTVIHRKGTDLTATRLGNLFEVQELYGGGQDLRPANITYEQEFAGGKTAVKIGIYNSGADFATLPSGCNFQNFAFCPRPTTLFYNSGFSGFPVPRWGLRVRQQIARGWSISAAVFEVNSLRAQTGHGWDLAPRFDSAVIPVELQWKSSGKAGQLPGLFRIGGLIDTTNKPDQYADANGANYALTGLAPATRQERWSAWIMGEKGIARIGPEGKGVLSVFGTFTTSDLHTARVPYFASAGLVAKGVWGKRFKDIAGIGLVYARVNPRITEREREQVAAGKNVAIQTYEASAEVYYGFQFGPLQVRPNVQYINHVGGSNRYSDAVVGG